ncbi:MAG: DUF2953 domain-containing protein [Firmicutes bacterium]|nr:DUF2953 domain-containing protein [Bacillota bacterium]
MEIFLYLLAGVAVILIFIVVIPVELRVRYGREGENDLLGMELFLWPGIKFRYRILMPDLHTSLQKTILRYKSSLEKGSGEVVAGERKKITIPGLMEMYRQYLFWNDIFNVILPSINYIKNRTKIIRLKWITKFGLRDPYQTGISSGIIWSIKGFMVSLLCSQIRLAEEPVLLIIPDFSKTCLATSFICILKTRTGYILFSALRVFTALLLSGRAVKIIRAIKN